MYMYTCAIKSTLKCTAMTWSNQMLSMVWNIIENEGALDILEMSVYGGELVEVYHAMLQNSATAWGEAVAESGCAVSEATE